MTAWTDPGLAKLAEWVRDATGWTLVPEPRLEKTLQDQATASGCSDPAEFAQALEAGRTAALPLIDELRVQESFFFRNPAHFEFLRSTAVPDLLEGRGPEHLIRCWVAGCAGGEESASLAISLAELGLQKQALILATDLSPSAVADAQSSRYRAWSLRGMTPEFRKRWFLRGTAEETEESGEFQLDRSRLPEIIHRTHNLVSQNYPSVHSGIWAMDVIFCRNVLLYFGEEAAQEVLERLWTSLAPGGYLFMASSDHGTHTLHLNQVRGAPAGVFKKVGRDRIGAERSWRPAAGQSAPGRRSWMPASVPTRSAAPHTPAPIRHGENLAGAAALQPAPIPREAVPAAEDPIEGAREMADLGDIQEALRRLEAHLARDPLLVEGHLLKSMILLEQGQHPGAGEAARKALYLDDSYVLGHMVLAWCHLSDERWDAAQKSFRNALERCRSLGPGAAVRLYDGSVEEIVNLAARQLAMIQSRSRN